MHICVFSKDRTCWLPKVSHVQTNTFVACEAICYLIHFRSINSYYIFIKHSD